MQVSARNLVGNEVCELWGDDDGFFECSVMSDMAIFDEILNWPGLYLLS